MPAGRALVDDLRGSRAVTLAALATLVILPLVPGVLAVGSPIALIALPVESIAVLLLLTAIRSPVVRRVIAGVYGALTVSRRILYVQAAPAVIALLLLWLAPRYVA